MKTRFITPLITEEIIGSSYAILHHPFIYFSEILDCGVLIPTNFICDYESVPILKATSKRGGVIHDYFCRKDSIPVVPKQLAADLYLEAQACRDKLLNENIFIRCIRFFRRHLKTLVVRVAPGYFHKYKVLSSIEELL